MKIVEIIPDALWVGNAAACDHYAANPAELGIRGLLVPAFNVRPREVHRDLAMLILPVDDEDYIPPRIWELAWTFYQEAAPLLVCCAAGVNRSVTFAGVLAAKSGSDLHAAWQKCETADHPQTPWGKPLIQSAKDWLCA